MLNLPLLAFYFFYANNFQAGCFLGSPLFLGERVISVIFSRVARKTKKFLLFFKVSFMDIYLNYYEAKIANCKSFNNKSRKHFLDLKIFALCQETV